VRLWDATNSAWKQTLKDSGFTVNSIAISPDSKVLASASSDDRTVQLWDVITGTRNKILKINIAITNLSFSFSGDGRYRLETDRGLLGFNSGSRDTLCLKHPTCGIFVDGEWVTQGEQKLL
jgi:WD40 repeat protein